MEEVDPNKVVALVIGVEDYEHVPKLAGPVDDACDFIDWLLAKGVPLGNIVLIAAPQPVAVERVRRLAERGVNVVNGLAARQLSKVDFQSIRNGLQKLRELTVACEATLLFVFGSGHGAVFNRTASKLALVDYRDDDMQALDVDNLTAHLRSADHKYPDRQVLFLDMCSSEIDTLKRKSSAASNELQFGSSRANCRQESLFAAASGGVTGLDEAKRRSTFWLQLSELLKSQPAMRFPYVDVLDGDFLTARWATHNVRRQNSAGSVEFSGAEGQERLSRRTVVWTIVVTFASLLVVVAAWMGWNSWRRSLIDEYITNITQAADVDALAAAVRDAKTSCFYNSIRSDLFASERLSSSQRQAASLFWDGIESPALKAKSDDREAETELIEYLASTKAELANLKNWLSVSLKAGDSEASTKSFWLALALAEAVGRERRTDSDTGRSLLDDASFRDQVIQTYRTHPDPGVHSALGLLLRRSGHDVRKIDQELSLTRAEQIVVAELGEKKIAAPTWYLTPNATTMVILPPGTFTTSKPQSWNDSDNVVKIGKVAVRHWFAIATTEITNRQFEEFAKEFAKTTNQSVAEAFPKRTTGNFQAERWLTSAEVAATRVSWSEAVNYCDWLQRKSPGGDTEVVFAADSGGSSVADSCAFRIPLESEWELACRSATKTDCFFGTSSQRLPMFAQFGPEVDDKQDGATPQIPGLKLPNRNGLFDLYGNVEEWCLDAWRDDMIAGDRTTWQPAGSTKSPARPLRGSSVTSSGTMLFSSFRQSQGENDSPRYAGFRLAKTIRMP
jgi:formylglycine-generating enzyme required for sulfatase activity